MQDSFITIFNKIAQYKSKGSFEGWLKRITINTALQKYREKAPLELIKEISVAEEMEEKILDTEFFSLEVLLAVIQELPDRYRLVFNLYVLDSYSHKEIAHLLKISENTSKSNLSRARNILRNKLETHQQKVQKA